MSSLIYFKNKKNNVTYVYENTSKWDSISKKCICNRKCIGQLNALKGEVIPNRSKTKIEPVESENTHSSVSAIGKALLYIYCNRKKKICDSYNGWLLLAVIVISVKYFLDKK